MFKNSNRDSTSIWNRADGEGHLLFVAAIRSVIQNDWILFSTLDAINNDFFDVISHYLHKFILNTLTEVVVMNFSILDTSQMFLHHRIKFCNELHQAEKITILWLKDPVNRATKSHVVLCKELDNSKDARCSCIGCIGLGPALSPTFILLPSTHLCVSLLYSYSHSLSISSLYTLVQTPQLAENNFCSESAIKAV